MTWLEWVCEMIYVGRWGGAASAAAVLGMRAFGNMRRIARLEAELVLAEHKLIANRQRIAHLEDDLVELRRAEAIVARAYGGGRGSTRRLHVVGSADVTPPLSVQLAEVLDERPPVGSGDAVERP